MATSGKELDLLDSILRTFPHNVDEVELILVLDGDLNCLIRRDLLKKVNMISLNMSISLMQTGQSSCLGPGYVRNLGIKAATGKYIHFVDDDDCIDYASYRHFIAYCRNASADIIIGGLDDSSGVMSNHEFIAILPSSEISTNDFSYYLLLTGFEPLQIQQFLFLRSSVEEFCLLFPNTFLAEDIAFTVSSIVTLKTVAKLDSLLYTYLSRTNSTKTLDTPKAAANHLAAIQHMIEYCQRSLEKGHLVSAASNSAIIFMRHSISRIILLFLVRIQKFRGVPDVLFDELLSQDLTSSLRQALGSLSSLCNEAALRIVPTKVFHTIDDLEKKIFPTDPISTYLNSYIRNMRTLENIYVVCFGPLGKSVASAISECGYELVSVVDDRSNEFKVNSNFTFLSFDELSIHLSSTGNHCLMICNPNISVARRIRIRLMSILESIELFRLSPSSYNIIDLYSDIINT